MDDKTTGKIEGILIGAHPQVNGKTGVPFLSCSIGLTGHRIATFSVNDERDEEGNVTVERCKPVIDTFNKAADEGKLLVLEVERAVLEQDEEVDEDDVLVPVTRGKTRYFCLVPRNIKTKIGISVTGEIKRHQQTELNGFGI